jgi:hypothetical protein
METIRIRPLIESDFDGIISSVGGKRAHIDADRRKLPGADYLLNEAVLELKFLDEEGLSKPTRQAKLATLFRNDENNRPVIVLDRDRLSAPGQQDYDRILEGPIKTAVQKAKEQLKRSRTENPAATCSILALVNNGYTALDHDSLQLLVARRIRQDTSATDGVIVAGCYFYGDGFDYYFLPPFEYLPINLANPFSSFEQLQKAWNEWAERFATAMVRGTLQGDLNKGPQIDKQFDYEGVTFILPAPSMGQSSEFYAVGRPRQNTSGFECCPPVATTFPALTEREWNAFRAALSTESGLCDTFSSWRLKFERAATSNSTLRPFAPVSVTFEAWQAWCSRQRIAQSFSAVCEYANFLFHEGIHRVLDSVREFTAESIVPERYILVVTEEIGQDSDRTRNRKRYCDLPTACRKRSNFSRIRGWSRGCLRLHRWTGVRFMEEGSRVRLDLRGRHSKIGSSSQTSPWKATPIF